MRVVHVITRLCVGGAQENTIASVLGLQQVPGFEVSLCSGPTIGPEGSLEPQLASAPGTLTLVSELVRPLHPWKDVRAWQQLTSLFRERRPDVVHTHSGKAGVLGRLAAARAGVPVIVHTIHGPSFGAFQGRIPNLLFCAAERRAARVTTHFIVVAEAMRQQYLAANIGEPGSYSTIRSGFDLRPFLNASKDLEFRARNGFAPEDIVIGKIARLFKLKGHDDLLSVAPALVRECPRVKFLLVGDGLWRERLETRARSLGLANRFVFAGLVKPEVVPRMIGMMDIVVHLSLREGLPRALPQALAAGRPVVAYDCDGAGEVCIDGQTGYLVPPGDLTGLQRRLVELSMDPALRTRLGQRGQELVRDRFDVRQMVEELRRLYERLAANRIRRTKPEGRDHAKSRQSDAEPQNDRSP